MDQERTKIARACLEAAEDGSMTFPEIVAQLAAAGFESYVVDFRRATAAYHCAGGDSLLLEAHQTDAPVAARFNATALQAAIREAQTLTSGYTYRGFRAKAAAAGCAFYVVSFSGRRALYVGRTAEVHVELFPDQP